MLPHLHDVIFKRYKDTIRDNVWLDHGGIRSKIFVNQHGNFVNDSDHNTLESYHEAEINSFSLDDYKH